MLFYLSSQVFSEYGAAFTTADLREWVQQYLKTKNVDRQPGKNWPLDFLNRHASELHFKRFEMRIGFKKLTVLSFFGKPL